LTFNIHMYSNADAHLLCQLVASSVTKQDKSLEYLPVIAGYLACLALFLMQWVQLCLLFTVSCSSAGQALKTVHCFIAHNKIHLVWKK